MRTKLAKIAGASAVVLSVGALGAGTASAAVPAATPEANPVGSVAVCLTIPVGPLGISFCL